jgi:hypothetical protein
VGSSLSASQVRGISDGAERDAATIPIGTYFSPRLLWRTFRHDASAELHGAQCGDDTCRAGMCPVCMFTKVLV